MAKLKYKICIIAIGDEKDVRNMKGYGIKMFAMQKIPNAKASVRWTRFKAEAKRIYKDITAKNYFACDVYSLPVASDLKKQSNLFGAQSILIYDSREIYSALGPLAGRGLKQMLLTQAEKVYVKNADKIVTTGKHDTNYLMGHFKTKAPFIEIYNYPPYRNHLESNILRDKLQLPDSHLLVLYQGMLLDGRGIIPTINAIAGMDKVHFAIVGRGEFYPDLSKYVMQKKLQKRVHFTGAVPYTRLHEITSSADIGICLFEPITLSYEYALPNKLFEYTMARIPSLVTNFPQMAEVIEEHKTGLLIEKECKPEEIRAQLELLRDRGDREEYVENCQKAAPKIAYESQKMEIKQLFNI